MKQNGITKKRTLIHTCGCNLYILTKKKNLMKLKQMKKESNNEQKSKHV